MITRFSVIFFTLTHLTCCALSSSSVSRRRILAETTTIALSTGSAFSSGLIFVRRPEPANAARGAAELDLEYYLRDLAGGNRKEGNVLPSAPPVVAPPRTLQDPVLSLLLNDSCSIDCLPTRILISQIQKRRNEKSSDEIEKEIRQRVATLRDKVSPRFYARAPWKQEHVSDQYYFDVTAYALWRTAAELLPNLTDRDDFMRELGRNVYKQLLLTERNTERSLVGSLPCLNELLSVFTAANICKGYRLGELVQKEQGVFPFLDEYDDKALKSGASVDCLISIFEPATLGASLQITGEQSRFVPDFVGPTVAAMWETMAGVQSSWDTFFVDPVYRPNPKDYFPDEQLLQFTLIQQQPIVKN